MRPGSMIFIAILLAPAAMSGCFGPGDGPLQPFVVPLPEAFYPEAQHASGSTAFFNLSGPVPVKSHQGMPFSAYVLEKVVPREEGPAGRQTWYLDQDLRLVADVWGCGLVFGSCEESEHWFWYRAGELGPMGLGYPNHLYKGTLDLRSGGQIRPVMSDHQVDEDGRLKVTVEIPEGKNASSQKGPYWYTPGRMLPDSEEWTVRHYESLGPMEPAERLRLPLPRLAPAEWEGLMFPGEDEDPFDVGVTHLDLVQAAFPDLDAASDECVHYYTFRPAGQVERPPVSGVANVLEPEKLAHATIEVVQEGRSVAKEVEAYRDPVDESVSYDVSSGPRSVTDLTCAEVRRSPWPGLGVEEGFVLAQSLVQTSGFATFEHQVGFQRDTGRLPEWGWHTYRFHFKPEASSAMGMAHYAAFDATENNTLSAALVPPDGRFTGP